MTRISYAALILTTFCTLPPGWALRSSATAASDGSTQSAPSAQSAPVAQPSSSSAPNPDGVAGSTPSGVLKPSLDALEQTITGLQLEKWKKGPVREEAAANISSIQRDLESTLPSLLAAADQAPGAMSKTLPVSRNVAALYDVLLRVVDSARMVAPGDQFTQLQDAMTGLEKGRHGLDDQMQDRSTTQEKQIGDLQVALKTRPVPVCPVTPPPAELPPAKKVVPKKRKPAAAKPAAKPATTPPATSSQPATPTKPQQ